MSTGISKPLHADFKEGKPSLLLAKENIFLLQRVKFLTIGE
jgi:hypothetical protein